MTTTHSDLQDPLLLTLPAAARRAGIGLKRLRLACCQGELPVYSVGSRWRLVAWPDVLSWLGAHRLPPPGATEGNLEGGS